jgi:hypothetical protein
LYAAWKRSGCDARSEDRGVTAVSGEREVDRAARQGDPADRDLVRPPRGWRLIIFLVLVFYLDVL